MKPTALKPNAFWALLLLVAAHAAIAQTAPTPTPPVQGSPLPPGLAEKAARRFPQPVRVGDLIDRAVLEPKESQPVLGRVDALVRRPDGGVDLVMRYGGILGFGTRRITVPTEAMALLGEYVAVMDLTPDELARLPTTPVPTQRLANDDHIRMGLVRPFH